MKFQPTEGDNFYEILNPVSKEDMLNSVSSKEHLIKSQCFQRDRLNEI